MKMSGADMDALIDWDSLYMAARVWGIQPGHFWDMTFPEWFCEADARRDRSRGDYAGKLTRGDVDELQAIAQMTDEEWKRYNDDPGSYSNSHGRH